MLDWRFVFRVLVVVGGGGGGGGAGVGIGVGVDASGGRKGEEKSGEDW